MILKKYFVIFFTVILVSFVNGGKNSDESNKPDIARMGKTKKAKMGKSVDRFI